MRDRRGVGRALRLLGAVSLLAGLAPACRHGFDVAPREAGRLGTVRVFRPSGTPIGLVILFSDGEGWGPAFEDAAGRLASHGAAVVGVDLPQYLHGLAASDDGCHYVVGELEDLGHRLERELGSPDYSSPVLAGAGAGGTLAYAALAQAPATTVAGAVGPEPLPPLRTRVPLCAGARSEATGPDGFTYDQASGLPGWWQGLPPGSDALVRLRTTIEQRLEREATASLPAEVQDLPLTEVRAVRPGDTMAVIYSGDGGWRDLDKQIAEVLASQGVPVVGVDCLRYFWHRKEPDTLARDLDRVLRHYTEAWRTPHVLLVGYSFGADVLPFIVNRLAPDTRRRVEQVSLLGLGAQAVFEFHVTEWLADHPSASTRAVLPEVLRLDLRRVQCVYGAEEHDSLCRVPALASAEIIGTAGGHHFDGDYRALAARILDGARRRRELAGDTGRLHASGPSEGAAGAAERCACANVRMGGTTKSCRHATARTGSAASGMERPIKEGSTLRIEWKKAVAHRFVLHGDALRARGCSRIASRRHLAARGGWGLRSGGDARTRVHMRPGLSLLLALGLVAARVTVAPAKDEAKAACKRDCVITLQTCKAECQVERDSGTAQESYLYRQCDQSCHDAYGGCTSACESP